MSPEESTKLEELFQKWWGGPLDVSERMVVDKNTRKELKLLYKERLKEGFTMKDKKMWETPREEILKIQRRMRERKAASPTFIGMFKRTSGR